MRNSYLFALYIHHAGRFVQLDNSDVYAGGESEGKFHLNPDTFGYFDVEDVVEKLGYGSWSKIWWKIPNSNSFRVLKNDKDVMEMLSYLDFKTRVLHVYVDGGIVAGVEGEKDGVGSVSEGGNAAEKADIRCVSEGGNAAEKADIGGVSDGGGVYEGGVVTDGGEDEEPQLFDNVVTNEGKGKEKECSDEDDEGSDYYPMDGEGSDYYPMDGESSDDELADDELESDDEEYVQSRQKVKSRVNIFDLVDEEVEQGIGFSQVYEHDHVESDYASSDGEVCSDSTDEENEGKRNNKFKSSYDPRTKPKKLKLQLGMRFSDGFQLKEALTDNAIAKGRYIKFGKVSKTSCRATCKPPCKWIVFGSLVQASDVFMIKTYYPTHSCTRKNNNRLVSSRWIAAQYQNVFRVQPNLPIKLLAEDLRTRHKTMVGKDRLYRARAIAQEMMRGSVEDHYAMLRRYVAELIRVDRDGTYMMNLGEGAVFKGLYIGHSALRHGFKKSCRPVIGLDGCFLKTYLGGILLCAVGKDGNNQMFPIAWAIVEVENEECWQWFLQLLLQDLAISDGNGWTFISDQQKGLMNAVANLAPLAEHRNCARHVYMNWKKLHKGTSLKNIFWSIARSTYVQEYNMHLEELKAENAAAHADFVARDVSRFCKVFISPHSCSDMISNNIAETFNGYILEARGMHIIHMCEQIRRDLMVRQVEKVKMMAMVSDKVCPRIMKKLEKKRKKSIPAYVFPNMDKKFEVSLKGMGFVVDMVARTCSCRGWELTGIPCVHACAAIHFEGEEPSAYVHPYYTVDRYLEAYKYAIEPLVSELLWPEVEGYVVKPPVIRKMPGRPKKVRKRDPEEDPKNPHKLKRFGLVMTCQNCKQKGHNIKTCTNEKAPPQPKGKRGRPRIHPSQPLKAKKVGREQTATSSQSQHAVPSTRRVTRTRLQQHPTPSSSNLTGGNEGPSTQESRNPAAGLKIKI